MVGIGIVGIGFMGMIHDLAAQKLRGGQVVALCSRDPRKLAGDCTGIQGNFGPRGTQMDLSTHALYPEVDRLLADPAVDPVDLCVPNDEHARFAIKALNAGKHVLVEKPIALSHGSDHEPWCSVASSNSEAEDPEVSPLTGPKKPRLKAGAIWRRFPPPFTTPS
jgi:hypothetical protein